MLIIQERLLFILACLLLCLPDSEQKEGYFLPVISLDFVMESLFK